MRTSINSKRLAVRLGGAVRRCTKACLAHGRAAAAGVAILSGGMGFVGPAQDAHAVDLIVNGGFENNNGFNGDNSGFGWYNDSDAFVFDVYDHTTQSYNPAGTLDPPNGGQWYFHTVGISDATGVYQDMDLTAGATTAQIDAGTVAFDIQAFLAGFGTQDDHARIEVTFADGGGSPIGGIATILDGGIEIDPGPPQTLVHDNPSTFVGFVDATVDPFNANDRYTAWKEYGDTSGVPVGARTARVTIFEDSKTGNGNDDYVDNVSFDVADTGVEQFMKIEVNKTTGAISMINGSPDALDINYYEIRSAAGTLSNGWNSFADQMLDSQGGDPEDNWQEGGGSGPNLLTEAFLASSPFATGGDTETLANAYTGGAAGAEDLIFQYGLADGRLIRGIVAYDPGDGMTLFDANVDGTVNNDDIPDFVTALLNVADWQTLHPGLDPLLYLDGDGSGVVNNDDIPSFVAALLNPPFLSGSTSAVPEPSTFVLLAGISGLLLVRSRYRQS